MGLAFRLVLAMLVVGVGYVGASSCALAEARIALLIGNQGYNAKVGPLKNPHNDIALIGAALKSLGFKVTEIKDADYRTVDAAIKRHVATVRREGKGAISFVYYSGHGAADPDTMINYLIPVDVASAEDEELWNYSLNLNTVVEGLRAQAPGATHYVIFDACRNELNLTRKGQKALSDKGFVPIPYTPGVMVAYATSPGRTASDVGSGGGPYAKALAEEIVKPGVDSMLVFTRVARRVQSEIGQDPFLSASTMPEVYFAVASTNSSATEPKALAPSVRLSEAAEAWDRVKDTTNAAVLEAFIKRYRETFYAEMAKARVEELTKQKSPSSVATTPTRGEVAPPCATLKESSTCMPRADCTWEASKDPSGRASTYCRTWRLPSSVATTPTRGEVAPPCATLKESSTCMPRADCTWEASKDPSGRVSTYCRTWR
jgi:uncharacterized caspase-like protein